MVHSLIKAYKMLPELEIISSRPASHRELCKFHEKSYVNFLRVANKEENLIGQKSEDQMDGFGLGNFKTLNVMIMFFLPPHVIYIYDYIPCHDRILIVMKRHAMACIYMSTS